MSPKRDRPAVNGPVMSADAATANSSLPTLPAGTDQVRQRQAWARRMIRAATGPIPCYGSRTWAALPETDRRRVAAVVVAAEAWQQQCDELPGRLGQEIATMRAEQQQHEAASFAEMAAGVRRLASVPSFAELCDRRGEPERAQRSRAHAKAMREHWNTPAGGDAA